MAVSQPVGPRPWARALLAACFFLVRLLPRTKKPFVDEWQLHPITSQAEVDQAWGKGENVGILLGVRGGGVLDLDLDDKVARANIDLLPSTSFSFGRASVGPTHVLYCPPDIPDDFKSFALWSYTRQGEERKKLVEVRYNGLQVMTLGSVWSDKDGILPDEPIVNYGSYPLQRPAARPLADILQWARVVAAIACAARLWPRVGGRNDFALRLTGGLVLHGLAPELAELIAQRAARAADDEEWERRGKEAHTAAQRIANKENVEGFTSLEKLFDCPGFGKHLCGLLDIPWRENHDKDKKQAQSTKGGGANNTNGNNSGTDNPPRVRVLPDTANLGINSTGAKLMEKRVERPAWVVQDLIMQGSYGILQGRPKGGKSWLALQLAICAAYGVDFLGLHIHAPMKVTLLALEDKVWRLQDRVGKLLSGLGLPVDSRLENLGWTILRENYVDGDGHLAGFDWLEWLIQNDKATLAIVDTQARLQGTMRQPGYEADYQVGVRYQEMAQRLHCAILGLTHTKKRQNLEEDHLDASQGTTGNTAAQDLVVTLGHARGTQLGRLQATGRDLDHDHDLALHYDPAKGPWFSDGATPQVMPPKDRARLWLSDHLSDGPRPAAECLEQGNAVLGMSYKETWWRGILADLGGRHDKKGPNNSWLWSLGKDEPDDNPPDVLPFEGGD